MIGIWIQRFWERSKERFRSKKKKDLNKKFAAKISQKYEWKQENGYSYVSLVYGRAVRQISLVQTINQQKLEQIIQKYIPKLLPAASPVVQRQERTKLLSVIENIGHQDGEQKQLEQLIFRRKEQEWKKIMRVQEEEVVLLRQELVQQRKIMEHLERKVEEPVVDTEQLFIQFRKKMEQQLRLERQRAGL